MWIPNSIQVPTQVVMKALHGEVSPETMLAVVAFTTFPKWSGMSLLEQFALTPANVTEAANLLQIGSIEMEERDESPSTPTGEEMQNQESSFSDGVQEAVNNFFPEATVTDQQLKELETISKGELQWIVDILTVIHQGHLEKNNVYEPMGLVFWWLKQPRISIHNKAHAIRSRPKTRDSIIGESLERARKNIPPPPGPTPEKVAARKEQNEKLRNAKST